MAEAMTGLAQLHAMMAAGAGPPMANTLTAAPPTAVA
jgi:hypothetical protein